MRPIPTSDSEVKGGVGSPVAFRKVPRASLNGAFLSLWVCTHLPQIYSSQQSPKGGKKKVKQSETCTERGGGGESVKNTCLEI